jgi:hypothetical protein
MFIFNKRLHLIYYISHCKTNQSCTNIHWISLLVWIFALSNGIICLNFKNIVLQDIDISNNKIKSVILLIISLYCKTVWLNRNVKKKWKEKC